MSRRIRMSEGTVPDMPNGLMSSAAAGGHRDSAAIGLLDRGVVEDDFAVVRHVGEADLPERSDSCRIAQERRPGDHAHQRAVILDAVLDDRALDQDGTLEDLERSGRAAPRPEPGPRGWRGWALSRAGVYPADSPRRLSRVFYVLLLLPGRGAM